VIFGLVHGELQQFAGLAALGTILAVVALRTNRLGMNMVAHASFNAVAIAIYFHDSGVIR
jgi:membrane protease YdiL (CAAX protease family)